MATSIFTLKLQGEQDFIAALKRTQEENKQAYENIAKATEVANKAQANLNQTLKERDAELAKGVKLSKEVNTQYKEQIALYSKERATAKNEISGLQDTIRYRNLKLDGMKEEILVDRQLLSLKQEEKNENKVTADQLLDRLIKNKELINQTKELTDAQKELLFVEQKKQYLAEEEKNANKVTLEQLREKIRLNKASQQTVQPTTAQRTSFANEQYKQNIELLKQESKAVIEQKEAESKRTKEKYATVSSLLAQRRAEEENNKKLKESFERTYQNTAAQNKYNDALSRLNQLRTMGVIDANEFNTALDKEKKALKEKETSMSNLANTTIRYLRWAGTIAGVLYAGQRAWDLTIGKGIEVNKIIENNTYGIAALVSANTQMVDSLGNTLSPIEKFVMGQKDAKEIIEQLRIESVKTAATFPQLLEIFQQGIGKTLSMGDAFGATTKEIEQNTIKLASRMSNFANAIGMPMDRVKEEMRSLVSGNASTDSLISTIIFGSPGEANKAVKEAENKVNGVAELLDKKFKPFDILADTKTFDKSVLAIQDAWSRAMGDMVEKSGAFKDITNMFYDMASTIGKDTDATVKKFDELYQSAKNIGSEIKQVADLLYEPLGFIAGIYAATTAIKVLSLAIINNPITALATGIIATSEATKQYIETMQRGGQTLEQWNNQISEQDKKWSSPEETQKRIQANIKEIQTKIDGISKTEEVTKELYKTGKVTEEHYNKIVSTKQKIISENEALLNSYKTAASSMEEYDEAKKQAENITKETKERGQLLANIKIDTERIKEDEQEILKVKGNAATLEEEISKHKKIQEETSIKLKKAESAQQQAIKQSGKENANIAADIATLKKDISNQDTLILLKQQKIKEENEKTNTQSITAAKTRNNEAKELNKKESENKAVMLQIKALQSGMIDEDRLKISLSQLQVEALQLEVNSLQAGYDKNKAILALEMEKLNLKKLQTQEQEKQNNQYKFEKISGGLRASDMENLGEIYKELTVFYKNDPESLADLAKWVEREQNKLDKKPLTLNIKLQGWDEVSNSLATFGNTFQEINKAQKEYEQENQKVVKDEGKLKQARIDLRDTTISGIADMTGAISSFYDEDDSRRKKQLELQKFINATKMAMQLAELAQTITVETAKGQLLGANALAAQLQLPFPANIPAYAMVAAMLGSLGIMIGGKAKTSTSSDAFSSMAENTGTGTVLGDTSKQSESITKALETLKDFAQPQYQTLQSMNKYLETIATNIGGVTNLLIRSGGFKFGEGYTGFDTGFKNNLYTANGAMVFDIATNSILGKSLGLDVNKLVNSIPIIGDINKMMGGIINSVVGGLFGKKSTSQALTDSGIYFADTLLQSAIKQFNGEAYQTIQTTTTKKSWFGSSSSSAINSYFQGLDDETERQFSLVLDNLYSTVITAGQALDSTQAQVENSLSNFVVSLGKISLKDKTGSQIQESLTAIFGEVGDDIAKTAFPLLTAFQQIGEGMFETLTRVATGMEESEYYISRLGNAFKDVTYTAIGNKQGNVGFEALFQSIKNVEKATYPTNNGLLNIVENLDATAEELYTVYVSLDELRSRLVFLKQTAEGLSSSMIYGAGSVEALSEGFNSFFENFLTDGEQLVYKTEQLSEEFNKLGLSLPVSKESFKSLLSGIDTTSKAGQELYGRLIILSESFADVSDATQKSIETLQEELDLIKEKLTEEQNIFKDVLKNIATVGKSFLEIANTLDDTISSLLGKITGSNAIDNSIESYWKKREQIQAILLKGSNITSSESEKLKSLTTELGSVATSIQSGFYDNTTITKDLVGDLSKINSQLNFTEKILQVNIVDGLGDLLGLNQEQVNQLKTVASDGKITNTELNSINGLTQTQKDGIIDFSKNSEYFSTEATLSDLAKYSKLQLDEYNRQVAEETAGLSKQTLTYGDYVGKQEQIDISKLLGVSYESAKPLIEQLQTLSLQGNKTDYYNRMKEIVGFNSSTGEYNKDIATQISTLSQYLPSGGSRWFSFSGQGAINNLSTEQQNVISGNLYTEYSLLFDSWKKNYDAGRSSYQSTGSLAGFDQWIKSMQALEILNEAYSNVDNYSVFTSKMGELMRGWNNIGPHEENMVKYRDKLYQLRGYAVGGYTGNGRVDEVAGVVHGQEYVVESNKLKAVGGVFALEQMLNSKINQSKVSGSTNNVSYGNVNKNDDIILIVKKMEERLEQIETSSKGTYSILNEAQIGSRPLIVEGA